ncbi:MAG: hypothetical protein JWQ01_2477 [Massilia sp.]|jgi:hypothetical protein|nr:hypothetical protein [Massilia sp.]
MGSDGDAESPNAQIRKLLKYKTFWFMSWQRKAAALRLAAAFSGTILPNELPNQPVCDRPEAV